jgi:uncharacterized membrane protein YraQ (UPF0718 family)
MIFDLFTFFSNMQFDVDLGTVSDYETYCISQLSREVLRFSRDFYFFVDTHRHRQYFYYGFFKELTYLLPIFSLASIIKVYCKYRMIFFMSVHKNNNVISRRFSYYL